MIEIEIEINRVFSGCRGFGSWERLIRLYVRKRVGRGVIMKEEVGKRVSVFGMLEE